MTIIFFRQRIMSLIIGRIFGLLHTAQQRKIDGSRFRLPFNRFNDLLQLRTTLRLSNGDAQTQAELFKIPHLQFVRIAVDSTQKRQTFALQKSGDRNVGGQHEFFNDLVAFIMMPLVSPNDGPVLIEINFDFRDSHGQRAVGIAEPSKHHRQLKHIVEQLTDRCRDALDLLRPETLVIVPAGRDDILMAASLAAVDGTKLAGLLLARQPLGALLPSLPAQLGWMLLMVLLAGAVGSRLGSRHWPVAWIRRCLALVLLLAASKLLGFAG